MRLVRFKTPDLSVFHGVLEGDRIISLGGDRLIFSVQDVRLLPPALPSKVVCVGLNYRRHAEEFSLEVPDEPVIFMKPSTSVIGPGDSIPYPKHLTGRVDYEGELGVVIGRVAKGVRKGEERNYILGYTCVNDVTARDLQKKDGQWTRAKSFDGFCPIGPWIETSLDPSSLRIETYLNGKKVQSSSTEDLIFDVFYLVRFVTSFMTLMPGDIISTGTPSGVGPMVPGDEVEVRIEGVGSLRNRVVSG